MGGAFFDYQSAGDSNSDVAVINATLTDAVEIAQNLFAVVKQAAALGEKYNVTLYMEAK